MGHTHPQGKLNPFQQNLPHPHSCLGSFSRDHASLCQPNPDPGHEGPGPWDLQFYEQDRAARLKAPPGISAS